MVCLQRGRTRYRAGGPSARRLLPSVRSHGHTAAPVFPWFPRTRCGLSPSNPQSILPSGYGAGLCSGRHLMLTSRRPGTEGACPPPAPSARAEGPPSAGVRDEPCACRRRQGSAVTLHPGPAHLLALLRPKSLLIQNSADAPWRFPHSGGHAALLLGLPPRPCSPGVLSPQDSEPLDLPPVRVCPSSRTLAHGSPSSESPPSGRETSPLKAVQPSLQLEPGVQS